MGIATATVGDPESAWRRPVRQNPAQSFHRESSQRYASAPLGARDRARLALEPTVAPHTLIAFRNKLIQRLFGNARQLVDQDHLE